MTLPTDPLKKIITDTGTRCHQLLEEFLKTLKDAAHLHAMNDSPELAGEGKANCQAAALELYCAARKTHLCIALVATNGTDDNFRRVYSEVQAHRKAAVDAMLDTTNSLTELDREL